MSHFVVTVAVTFDADPDAVIAELSQVLDRYDENKEVEPYGAETVAEITADDLYLRWKAEHPELDQEAALKRWLGEDVEFDADGRRITTYNPDSKWDWWEVGGRWDGYLVLKDGTKVNVAQVGELAPEAIETPYAYVNTVGEWHEQGKMGWFGLSRDDLDREVWVKQYLDWIAGLDKDTVLVAVDCHI